MGELLLELLGLIVETLLEAFLEYVVAALASLLLRALGAVFKGSEPQNPALVYLGYCLFGVIFGGISLALFPHPLVHPSKIHGISLLVSPALVGLLMAATGAILRRHQKTVTQLESFSCGFSFAFGLALMRFLFTK
jgi:hypothetical protein